MDKITFEKVIADIIKVSAHGDDAVTQQMVRDFCKIFSEFLMRWAEATNGYMFMAAFAVSFTEIRKIAASAKGEDKILIDGLIKAVIGSYGSTVQ